ncbi:MAG: hypothetical protein ACI9Y7_002534 [Dokdonia sp.]|jgi:hypothetical protein
MNTIDQEKYERAKKQVENEKGWYTHFFIYMIINIGVQLFYSGVFDGGRFTDYIPWWVRFTTPFFWGISLFVHWVYAFKKLRFGHFYKGWEERKIKKYMEEEEKDFMRNSRK